MLTYLRLGNDALDDARLYQTQQAAIRAFARCAIELDLYGQRIEGSLHFVDSRDDVPVEYPDQVLALGPRGGIQVHRT